MQFNPGLAQQGLPLAVQNFRMHAIKREFYAIFGNNCPVKGVSDAGSVHRATACMYL